MPDFELDINSKKLVSGLQIEYKYSYLSTHQKFRKLRNANGA